ncbi:MAG: mechanosensitive ion channel [Flavobacteriia bacterium]|nr:mechanosensitive ion channel [Flavobacteriia bacterium]
MHTIQKIFTAIKDFLGTSLYDSATVHISLGTLLLILSAIIVVSFLLKLVRRIVNSKLPEEDKNKFNSIFGFLKYLFYILAVVTVLHTSGIDLTVFLTASAALFVGLGFALQYLFQDIISGILIILDQSLHVGDIIEVDDKVGKVLEIRLRTTRAITRDDKVVVIPNHIFLTNSIFNYTQNHKTTREKVSVGVSYSSDILLVTQLLESVADHQKGVLKSPKPFVLFDNFGDSALEFSLHFSINDSFTDPKLKSEIRYKIAASFKEHQISIPFPQRDVHLYKHS